MSDESVPMSRAVVLAGGLGMRLRPYTAVLPKPLMPIGDRPVLDIVIRQLRHHHFQRVTIATGYLAELIEAFFRDGQAYSIPIDYFREQEPLGTVGALGLIEGLDDDFLVMNGDVLTDLDYAGLMDFHRATGAVATIASARRSIEVTLGVLRFTDPHQPDRLTAFDEKPSLEYEASMGVYAFAPRIRDFIEPGERLDFPDLIVRLLDAGEPVRAWRPDCYWLDIGRHDDYEQAMDEFERMRHLLIPGDPVEPGERLDERRSGERRGADRRDGDESRTGMDRRMGRPQDTEGEVIELPRRQAPD
jgi:NDP-sugar pyrophosphorylase family protein